MPLGRAAEIAPLPICSTARLGAPGWSANRTTPRRFELEGPMSASQFASGASGTVRLLYRFPGDSLRRGRAKTKMPFSLA